jgi:hypothetical protein
MADFGSLTKLALLVQSTSIHLPLKVCDVLQEGAHHLCQTISAILLVN